MRLFIAIEFPLEVKRGIELLQKAEAQREIGFRWTRRDQLHLTMKFLGELDEAQVESAWRALESITSLGPCTLGFGGFRYLPNERNPRVLALDLSGDADRLGLLHGQIEQAFEAQGFARERRPFSPHVTVARRNEREHHSRVGLYFEKPWQACSSRASCR